jgi:hypothetical protein
LAEKGPPTGVDDAPDCRQSRRNQTIWFDKSDSPVCPLLSRSFWFLFVSYANTFWQLCWAIDYFKHIKHEWWKLWQQRSDLNKGNILKPTFYTMM